MKLDFVRRVVDTVTRRQLFDPGARVLVAVSGGPDSCALLLSLVEASQRGLLSRPVGVAHFHHGLRGVDADGDAGFVAGLCARLHLPCVIGLGKVPGKNGHYSSDTARAHRYAFLHEAARDLDADTLATAHHRDDQAETVLWRVLRGTGLNGLGGIPPRRHVPEADPPLSLVRPLLDVSRSDIEAYCQAQGLATRYDPSNGETHFARVRLRRLLPELARGFNPRLSEALTRLADQARVDDDLLQGLADALWHRAESGMEHEEGIRLDAVALRDAHPALRQRVLLRALRRAFPSSAAIVEEAATGANVARLDVLLLSGRGQTDLPGHLRAVLLDGVLQLSLQPTRTVVVTKQADAVPLPVPGQVEFPSANLLLSAWETDDGTKSPRTRGSLIIDVALPPGKVDFRIVVRYARVGDRIALLGMGGRTRLLRSILSEAKVPVAEREQAVVVAREDTGEVLWLVGMVQAEATRVTDVTTRCVRLEARRLS